MIIDKYKMSKDEALEQIFKMDEKEEIFDQILIHFDETEFHDLEKKL